MEQSGNIGAVGLESVKLDVAGESAEAQINLGPMKLSLKAEIDNKMLLDLVVAKLPGGMMHDIAQKLEAILFPPSAPAA